VTRLDNEPCAWASGEFDIKWADSLDDGVVRCVETAVILSETGLEDAMMSPVSPYPCIFTFYSTHSTTDGRSRECVTCH
jgi:hypothetical protein